MLKSLEAEARHLPGHATRSHGICRGGWHISADEDGTITQHGKSFTASARDLKNIKHGPSRRHVAAIRQPVSELTARIGRRRKPEATKEMFGAEQLDNVELEFRVRGGPDIFRGLDNSRDGQTVAGESRPAVDATLHDAIDQLRGAKPALRPVGRGILEAHGGRNRDQHHCLADGIQLPYSGTAKYGVAELVKLCAELLSNKWIEGKEGPDLAEIRIRSRPECS